MVVAELSGHLPCVSLHTTMCPDVLLHEVGRAELSSLQVRFNVLRLSLEGKRPGQPSFSSLQVRFHVLGLSVATWTTFLFLVSKYAFMSYTFLPRDTYE